MGDMTIQSRTSTTNSIESITDLLRYDERVKVAGVDCDGVLRGKIMAKDKFLSSIKKGFGMSSAIFGWDMHDVLYTTETTITSAEAGYCDFIAIPDLDSFRRIPWERDIPFFLLNFIVNDKPMYADGRSMLRNLCNQLEDFGYAALAGTELEFVNFQTPSEDGYLSTSTVRPDLAAFLSRNAPSSLRPLTSGMFGYSITRPNANKDYFYDIFDTSSRFGCGLEAWHTESGPGVFEAAIKVCDVAEAADRVSLFKYLAKSVAMQHQATPCFMAKPVYGLPGNSGHIHISLVDNNTKENLFARSTPDTNAAYPDLANLSDLGRHFLAGILLALPDIMPAFAPTINSYKRLVENYWAPVHVSWGLEDRLSSIRLIAPPISSASATRFEIRIPGADLHPHYALSAILGAGLRGIQKRLEIPVPPTSARKDQPELLPNTLTDAVKRWKAEDSVAREIFGDEFVDFFAATREHELKVWREAVTDWEFKRYIETV